MKINFRVYGLFALAVLIFGATTPATVSSSLAQSTLEKIQQRGKLLAGVRFDYPPNGSVDGQGNNLGFGPDIARAFAERLGVEVEFVQTTSKNRIPMLLNGQIDADIGPTTPTKTRDEVVDFSYTYIVDQAVIMVREGESKDPKAYFNSDKVVGALQGSSFVGLWKDHSPEANIKEYQEFPQLVVALAQGKVDVVPVTEGSVYDLIEKLGDGAKDLAVGDVFYQDTHAIGLRENDSDWRDWVNWALQRMWADGSFQKIYKKHYKIDPPFQLGDAGRLQPGYEKVAKENDPW